ncbi:hypothetical protein HZ326_6333 [Fusarium oxysporum f. sp. albedinis]|nr:hypothetical protein HZ326_6333 [Fusarium oxysporum f. sp. albedinis]
MFRSVTLRMVPTELMVKIHVFLHRRVRRARPSVPWHVGESRSLIKNTWQLDLYGYRGDVCVVLHQKKRQGIVSGQYYIM